MVAESCSAVAPEALVVEQETGVVMAYLAAAAAAVLAIEVVHTVAEVKRLPLAVLGDLVGMVGIDLDHRMAVVQSLILVVLMIAGFRMVRSLVAQVSNLEVGQKRVARIYSLLMIGIE